MILCIFVVCNCSLPPNSHSVPHCGPHSNPQNSQPIRILSRSSRFLIKPWSDKRFRWCAKDRWMLWFRTKSTFEPEAHIWCHFGGTHLRPNSAFANPLRTDLDNLIELEESAAAILRSQAQKQFHPQIEKKNVEFQMFAWLSFVQFLADRQSEVLNRSPSRFGVCFRLLIAACYPFFSWSLISELILIIWFQFLKRHLRSVRRFGVPKSIGFAPSLAGQGNEH